jgi:hypothetical protein
MGILEHVNTDEPLTQGDILRGLKLFVTGPDWSLEGGSVEEVADAQYCMVVSRPCVCVYGHKGQIVVVSVEEFRVSVPVTVQTLDNYRKFFSLLRDGKDMPDRFYLGIIPGATAQRFSARLDSLHTILTPVNKADFDKFVRDHRVARLSSDFARDLHLRVFRSFSELGFDDYAWYETTDLEILVTSGNRDLNEARRNLDSKKLDLANKKIQGDTNHKHINNLEKEVVSLESQVKEIEDALKPFAAELARRTLGAEGTPS